MTEATAQGWRWVPEGLSVKPLEWEESRGNYNGQQVWSPANDIWPCWIVKNPDSRFIWCEELGIELAPASPVKGSFDTLEEAKAAAQIDYEQRILGALAAAPSAPVPSAVEREDRLTLFLRILEACGGETDANDGPGWIAFFCEDGEADTFNLAANRGFTKVTHDNTWGGSTCRITEAGQERARAALSASAPPAAPADEQTLRDRLLAFTDGSNWPEMNGERFNGYSEAMEVVHEFVMDWWDELGRSAAPADGLVWALEEIASHDHAGATGPARIVADAMASVAREALARHRATKESSHD